MIAKPWLFGFTMSLIVLAGMIQFGCGKDLAKEVEWLGKEAQK